MNQSDPTLVLLESLRGAEHYGPCARPTTSGRTCRAVTMAGTDTCRAHATEDEVAAAEAARGTWSSMRTAPDAARATGGDVDAQLPAARDAVQSAGLLKTPEARYWALMDALLLSQGGRCALCPRMLDGFGVIDHDHRSGIVRGWLCRSCNQFATYHKPDPYGTQTPAQRLGIEVRYRGTRW